MNGEITAEMQATGQCLCGAVKISAEGLKPMVDVCHCSMCRQWGGGPFMGVSATKFTVIGEDAVTIYRSSDWAERAFCSKCGSNLWYRFVPGDHTSFTAGLFGDGKGLEIEQQIFVDEKPGFYDFAQETPMKTGAQIIAEAEVAGHNFDD